MAGPGEEMVAGAGSHSHLRASRADRERVIDELKAAFVQGRLTSDELDERASQALASRTYAELAAVTADLPAGLAVAQPWSNPTKAEAGRPLPAYINRGVNACVATALGAVLLIAVSIFLDQQWLDLVGFGGIIAAVFLAGWVAAARKLGSRPGNGHGGQLPPHSASVTGEEQTRQISRAPRRGAEAVRRRLPRPQLSSSWPPPQWHPRRRRYAIGHADH